MGLKHSRFLKSTRTFMNRTGLGESSTSFLRHPKYKVFPGRFLVIDFFNTRMPFHSLTVTRTSMSATGILSQPA